MELFIICDLYHSGSLASLLFVYCEGVGGQWFSREGVPADCDFEHHVNPMAELNELRLN